MTSEFEIAGLRSLARRTYVATCSNHRRDVREAHHTACIQYCEFELRTMDGDFNNANCALESYFEAEDHLMFVFGVKETAP